MTLLERKAMDDMEGAEARTVSAWDEFSPSVMSPIREDGQVVGSAYWDGLDQYVIFDGLAYPPRMVIELRATETRPGVRYRMFFIRGKALLTDLQAFGRAGVGLRKADLDALSPDRLVQLALDAVVMPGVGFGNDAEGHGAAWMGTFPPDPMSRAQRRTHDDRIVTHGRPALTDDHYQAIADLYTSRGTVQAIADELDANYSTAARWVREARKRGMLPADRREKK